MLIKFINFIKFIHWYIGPVGKLYRYLKKIPNRKWIEGRLCDGKDGFCAAGHIGNKKKISIIYLNLLKSKKIKSLHIINDNYNLGNNPKTRVLNYLKETSHE